MVPPSFDSFDDFVFFNFDSLDFQRISSFVSLKIHRLHPLKSGIRLAFCSVCQTALDAAVAELTSRLARVGLSMHSAHEQALARMYGMVVQQAQALSYVDVYWLLAATCALMCFLTFLLAKNEPGRGGEGSMH